MPRDRVKPTSRPDPTSGGAGTPGTRYSHPAFGQLSASRVQNGSGETLYGSDFKHHDYIVIRIGESELTRTLSRDWPFSKNEIVEIAVSEAQWASFVSSLNVGQGVPCTITRRDGRLVPGIDATELVSDQHFKREQKEALTEALVAVQRAKAEINGLATSKRAKEAATDAIERAERALRSSVPFVTDQFEKHVETTIERAKTEVHAYAQNVIVQAGLEALSVDRRDVIEYQPTEEHDDTDQ